MAAAVAGPILMFQHCLDELKGWPDEAALDFDAFLSTNVHVDPVYGGSCAHINQNGEFELGVSGSQMGIFLLQGSHELDVSNPGGTQWYAIAPTGKMSGLVCTGAFELETTEFYYGDATGTPPVPPPAPTVEYFPGDQLTSPTETIVGAGPDYTATGKLFKTRSWPGGSKAVIAGSTDSVCAVVSRHNHVNHHRVPVLSFWPVYVPKN